MWVRNGVGKPARGNRSGSHCGGNRFEFWSSSGYTDSGSRGFLWSIHVHAALYKKPRESRSTDHEIKQRYSVQYAYSTGNWTNKGEIWTIITNCLKTYITTNNLGKQYLQTECRLFADCPQTYRVQTSHNMKSYRSNLGWKQTSVTLKLVSVGGRFKIRS
jgi:hypothetical protein